MKELGSLPRLLVVDDDDSFRSLLAEELAQTFAEVVAAETGSRALELCGTGDFDVVLLDIRMPGHDGLEILQELKAKGFDGEVIMLTGHATLDTAIRSLKFGAYDFLTKPCKLEELESIVQKAYEKRVLRKQNWTLRQVLDRQSRLRELIGESEPIRLLREMVRKVAATGTTVLICGESGVGKELVARAIHRNSPRKSQPFVIVDCTQLQEQLLQSELFGHEAGAFTGATALKHGLFEVADGGGVFMDEVGDLPLGLQAKLLHVLDTGTFRRLGGIRDLHVDVRILAATNHDLEVMVKEGTFRNDLYYRINVVSIRVPSLRERKDDIPRLVEDFIRRAAPHEKNHIQLSAAALKMLYEYSWPGNVRELQNVIERALILAEGEEIQPQDLPRDLSSEYGAPLYQLENCLPSLHDLEQLYIRNLLKRFSGHRSRIATTLGISERSLYRKLRGYGLE